MLGSLPKSNECVFVTMLRLVVQLRNGVRVLIFFFLLHKNLSFVYIPEFDFLFRGGSGVWCFINKSEQQSKATISKCSKQ